ncbi:uncharacterized protein J4E92_006641 [Alternaria infectoria]|uniref:uncharacterized protein n=1 Tax=Alternaria hordeiaustralica TaxID=1187925 RepID=UPI0020C31E54|nr:uncharacterized protein J4E84_010723 [Alternaria hordeiaustralica]XP_051351734.1 uncharacterized protein J4E92_006641 [Alternaria infectoria]KAI4674217.1 hypothetical protein J4E84_010723 [Alternaria hordeiaustralica]KAI4925905.1 hypothetical protein J4E92_006641 [Alternaria infectoria]
MSNRHARLHKRGYSASAVSSPRPLSPVADYDVVTFNRSDTPKVYEESWIETQRPMPSATSSHQLKIKPYLRKLSSKETSGLDLSRPAAENDLTGLGISEYGAHSRSISDVSFSPVNGRHRHNRSTSNTSQFSSSSGLQRPTPLPAIRQTPQPYTPPIAHSSPPSILGSEHEGDDIMSDDEFRLRQNAYEPARRSGSISSAQGTSLRIHTNNSSTRLAGSYSQSSVSLTSPIAQPRARGDTLKSIDTTSPSSRTSFDQTYRFIRGGRDSPVDPASRAASIRAARQKFEEEQRAKERKYEKVAHKQQERDYRKQQKKEDHQRRKSETLDRSEINRTRTVSTDYEKTPRPSIAGRPSVGGRQYSDHREAHSNSLPKIVATVDPEKAAAFSSTPKVTKSRAAKGTWQRFVIWLKTRLLRMSGK